MHLKGILQLQLQKKKRPTKDVQKFLTYTNIATPDYSFSAYEIIEINIKGSITPKYFLADLYDSKNNIVINLDEKITSEDLIDLETNGLYIIDLYRIKGRKNKILEHLDSVSRLETTSNLPLANLIGGLRETSPSIEKTILQTFETQEVQHDALAHTEITDLIGRSPGWILKSGISIIACVLAILLTLAYLVKYPDKINSRGIITTTTPPIALRSKTTGVIETIYVDNEATIQQNQELFYFKNTAHRNDITSLLAFIEQYQSSDQLEFVNRSDPPEDLKVGELQSLYALFSLTYNEYQQIINSSNVNAQINNIDSEIGKTTELIEIQKREQHLYEKELSLGIKDQERNRELNQEGIISDIDYEKSVINETQMKRQYESMNNGLLQNQIKINQLNLQTKQLAEERINSLNKYQFQLQEIITKIYEAYRVWSDKYIIKAEEDGILNYSYLIKPGLSIASSDIVAHITTGHNNQRILTSTVPSSGIGKLSKGSKAILSLDAYPHKEYGNIISQISSISNIPLYKTEEGEFYEVTVKLNDELRTDYGEIIEFTPQMNANVSYITENKSILSRIFNELNNLIHQ